MAKKVQRCIYPYLMHVLETADLDYRDLAPITGLSEMGVYRRITGDSEWKLPEVVAICKFFNEPDAEKLFQH